MALSRSRSSRRQVVSRRDHLFYLLGRPPKDGEIDRDGRFEHPSGTPKHRYED